jgi:hypothetical protein
MNMNAVGIDVSKCKSSVAILRPGGKVVVKPFDAPHLSADFQADLKIFSYSTSNVQISPSFLY